MTHALASPHLIAIASGKGGVGKTSFSINLAFQLARAGKKVLLLDGDTGLANVDIQLGISPQADLGHALSGEKSLAETITPTSHGFDVICGRSGHAGLARLALPQLTQWLAGLRTFTDYTHILLDAPAGVAPTTLALCAQADQTLLLTTPDPSSLADAYALVKLTCQTHGNQHFNLITNQSTAREGKLIATRLNTALKKFLHLPPLPHLATIPPDKQYAGAVKLHQLASVAYPNSAAVEAIRQLALTNLPTSRTA